MKIQANLCSLLSRWQKIVWLEKAELVYDMTNWQLEFVFIWMVQRSFRPEVCSIELG